MLRYRINRPTYWLMCAIVIAVLSALSLSGHRSSGFEFMIVLVAAPRLHDIGRSGWWAAGVVVAEFVTLVGAALGAQLDPETVLLLGGVWLLIIAALGVWLGTIAGAPHANKWGEPPAPGIQFGRNKPSR